MYFALGFILFSFSFLSYSVEESAVKVVTQTIPEERSNSKKVKRQLFDFKPAQAPWLEKYPPIQQEVEKILKKQKEDITKDAEELFQEFPTTALLPYSLYVQELKLFKHNQKGIVSVRLATRIYTGGAHGNYFYYSWNWDRQKNKFISLDEVVSPEQFTNLVKQVRESLIKQRTKKYEYDKEMQVQIERGTSEKKDFKVWNFKRDGIEFTFPEYQVASFAEGRFEVFVSLDSL